MIGKYRQQQKSYRLQSLFNFSSAIIQTARWDTSALDRFMLIYPFYYNNAKIILVVFNFGDQDSFDKCKVYANYIQNNCSSIVLLIGTRFADEQIISVDEAIDFAQLNDFQFFELKNDNFDALKTVVQKIVHKALKN
ncbi:Rab-like_protein [Hexamita inflata]|uniref:Rab-like protein n=1 Tax=Hexamita inflata TaxID=28002 RepID=A0AA86QM49_9EUKA|nr:Rab-like protein [Hexamita inflata]